MPYAPPQKIWSFKMRLIFLPGILLTCPCTAVDMPKKENTNRCTALLLTHLLLTVVFPKLKCRVWEEMGFSFSITGKLCLSWDLILVIL